MIKIAVAKELKFNTVVLLIKMKNYRQWLQNQSPI